MNEAVPWTALHKLERRAGRCSFMRLWRAFWGAATRVRRSFFVSPAQENDRGPRMVLRSKRQRQNRTRFLKRSEKARIIRGASSDRHGLDTKHAGLEARRQDQGPVQPRSHYRSTAIASVIAACPQHNVRASPDRSPDTGK